MKGEGQEEKVEEADIKFRCAPAVKRERGPDNVDPKATSGLRKQHNTLSKHSVISDGEVQLQVHLK